MKTEKPLTLIALLEQLLAETEKINIGRIYIAIIEETSKITFLETAPCHFSESVYKNLVHLSIKDFVHSGRSQDSIRVVREVIATISEAAVAVE